MNFIKSIKNLTLTEKVIWISSLIIIFISSMALPDNDWLSIATSLVGATALIFVAKGDPIGQLLCIFFSLCYAAVSFKFRYYGEMITYLGMSAPSALWALISWLRNPYSEREVKVAKMTARKWMYLSIGTILVTVVMGVILAVFNTPNLIVSIISVTTSFAASMLTILRSPYYALFYAANDIVLIVLWILATIVNIGYFPMIICFSIFLVNDIYGFINWRRIREKQNCNA
ncbi:MAG: nicotinamide mononucleotide transporter [Ruminococcaceae bacterium]|nr:nicotinamide mononucleotide transporter [Oscillospiraceae bacterium]